MNSRDSSAEWSGSSTIRASGSANTVRASANVTPCFLTLDSAFAPCHSNSTPTAKPESITMSFRTQCVHANGVPPSNRLRQGGLEKAF